ncbi:hypothetical protein DEJ50_32185 [Streptomyces venezuelae]|uniref:Uncharacterized protein n=2 Tax=Streptomyces venezuelae TaxID=54571 RepID=A0A5P2DE23_STRVZ|nr:hypothetical protein DEJ50_32185 [Streptomyces venezuelae]
MFSDDPADWIEYDKRQFRQILGRLTLVITGTLDPHLARYPRASSSCPAAGKSSARSAGA